MSSASAPTTDYAERATLLPDDDLYAVELARGPFGEILPPLFISDTTQDEALAQLIADNEAMGVKVDVPKKGQARQGMINVAFLYHHQLRIRRVLNGETINEFEQAVYDAVVRQGEPLSLRPPSLEYLTFVTFAPVFTCLTPLGTAEPGHQALRWRVGLPEQGLVEEFEEATPAQALARAQGIYLQWSEGDDDAFAEKAAEPALKAALLSLFHQYWLYVLEAPEGELDLGDGYALTLLGRHETMQLTTPTQTRILETERIRAIRILDGIRRRAGVKPVFPEPARIMEWLDEVQAPPLEGATIAWGQDARKQTAFPARINYRDEEYRLVERGAMLVMFRMEAKRGATGRSAAAKTAFSKPLAETVIEKPVIPQWVAAQDDAGRNALVRWALWAAGVE